MESKARFALEHLLRPLGLEPDYVGRDELGEGSIYYGPDISGLAESVLPIKYQEDTARFYSGVEPYRKSSLEVVEGELIWHLLFPYEEDEITGRTIDREGKSKENLLRFFDIVAASFYWLSDWQTLGQISRDVHGRLSYELSMQKSLDSPCLPFVDYYREILALGLQSRGQDVSVRQWGGKKMAACITHDIDYLKKWRKGMIYRDLIQRRRAPYKVLMELPPSKDPFKISFDWMMELEKERGFTATWFLKSGGAGRNDVVYNHNSTWLAKRIETLARRGDAFGLHGSYFTSDDSERFASENKALRQIVPDIICTRQHYLRFQHGKSPSFYQDADMLFDSSIAFADHEGFRTGTCHPHPIYDIENDESCKVWEFPLSVMESTLNSYRKLDLGAALEVTLDIIDLCNRFGGVAVMLWHNIIKDEDDFPDLDQHFENTLARLSTMDCLVKPIPECFDSWGRND